jgi:tRNA nucleotidyltransferase/poly(A) polymerase
MFMLENHLTSDQNKVVSQVQTAAAEAGMSLYLAGGAVRDMLGGFPIRDLDFALEGNPTKIVHLLESQGGRLVSSDETRKSFELVFPGGVTAEVAMARQERYAKPGAKPQVTPATIHEDLRGRDFTVNALGLSLNRASRGLLLDPSNGLSELESKELRATSNHTLYDRPIRIFRLIRFKARFGYQVAERTQSQYENARLAEAEKHISPRALLRELQQVAAEPSVGDIVESLEKEKLLTLISPALSGAKVNLPSFAKLQKARQMIPFGMDLQTDWSALLFYLLSEKLTPKERAAMASVLAMEKNEVESWQKLEAKALKLEKELVATKLQRPSSLFALLSKAPGEQILFLTLKSTQRLVQDRIKNYLQKYLPLAQEVSDQEVVAQGFEPGTPKFLKAKEQLISSLLNARPKKPTEEVVTEPLASAAFAKR